MHWGMLELGPRAPTVLGLRTVDVQEGSLTGQAHTTQHHTTRGDSGIPPSIPPHPGCPQHPTDEI